MAKIERPTKTFQRAGPWALVALILFLAFGGCAGTCAIGPFESIDTLRFAPNFRGYTFSGLALGLLSVVLAIACIFYSIRKRRDGTSSMMAWLWSHVWFGVLSVLFAALHGGCGLVSLSFSTGKLLFVLFLVLALTGLFWRRAYASIPKEAGPIVLNYSKEGALRRAEEQLLEIEKIAAGKSPELQRIKDMLLERAVTKDELRGIALPTHEHPVLDEIVRLTDSRRRALSRPPLQAEYTEKMQKWRRWHVPLTFAFVFFLIIHLAGAFDVSRKMVPLGAGTTLGIIESGPFAPFRPSEQCKDCHKTIYTQWTESMHAHALTSPLTIVQNNLDMKHSLKNTESPDPRRMCINCHGPAIAAVADGDILPLKSDRRDEGIECAACHQLGTRPDKGGGALASNYQAKLVRGGPFFGPLKSPIGNSAHRSDTTEMWRDDPSNLCGTCHDVHYDVDGDGRITKGSDLILQTTFDEWRDYQQKGGTGTCITCHMPVTSRKSSAADSALVPFEQDREGSDRKLHDHSFVGVDYPLDTVRIRDPQKAKRQALLATAATIELEARGAGSSVFARVTIENKSGHNLPTGFAFARQMWIELAVSDGGQTLGGSGILARPTDDLCDSATFGDPSNPLSKHVIGCTSVDSQLVNLQLKLVDRVTLNGQTLAAAPGAQETFLQHLTGGGVPRRRPFDGAQLEPLKVNERRTFSYSIPTGFTSSATVTARLLFRNLPPYWVRAMAKAQSAKETLRLEPLVDNIQTIEMASRTVTIAR